LTDLLKDQVQHAVFAERIDELAILRWVDLCTELIENLLSDVPGQVLRVQRHTTTHFHEGLEFGSE
jgi:hypothetical protein